jgi:hypothetical protein
MRLHNAMLAIFLLAVVACEKDADPVRPSDQGVVVVPGPARTPIPLERILEALADPRQTDGTLLIGLKEAQALRGVSLDGIELPVAARVAAAEAIAGSFPEIELVDGIKTSRTFIRVCGHAGNPLDITLLARLRAHPNVDYLAPNFTNGVTNKLGTMLPNPKVSAGS